MKYGKSKTNELAKLGLNLRVVNVDDLTPHPLNYNQHSESQVNELESSLEDFGQYKNIVAWTDPDSGELYILAGEGLWSGATQRGDTRIAVNDRSDLTRAEAMALMVSDNLTPSVDFDLERLRAIVDDTSFPREVPGLDERWLELVRGISDPIGDVEFPEYDESIADSVEYIECPSCGEKWPK